MHPMSPPRQHATAAAARSGAAFRLACRGIAWVVCVGCLGAATAAAFTAVEVRARAEFEARRAAVGFAATALHDSPR